MSHPNQVIVPGMAVRVRASANRYGHQFEEGTMVTILSQYDSISYHAQGVSRFTGEGIVQIVHREDIEVIYTAAPTVANTKAKEEEVQEVNVRQKTLYAVVDSENDIIASTTDRDYAREMKARRGGKANGIRIVAFKPQKEIR